MTAPDAGALRRATEALAALEHDQWWQWAVSVLDAEPGLSHDRAARWRALFVPYTELSEEMKERDRKWARRALAICEQAIAEAVAAEREACARAADSYATIGHSRSPFGGEGPCPLGPYIAAAIRARAKRKETNDA